MNNIKIYFKYDAEGDNDIKYPGREMDDNYIDCICGSCICHGFYIMAEI